MKTGKDGIEGKIIAEVLKALREFSSEKITQVNKIYEFGQIRE